MSERLHPDGLPMDATPFADMFHDRHLTGRIKDTVSEVAEIEIRARRAEADLAHLIEAIVDECDIPEGIRQALIAVRGET